MLFLLESMCKVLFCRKKMSAWRVKLDEVSIDSFLVFCASFYEIAFLKVGDIFCSLALILVWSGSGRGWRPSSCKSYLLFFSTASGPKNNFVKRSLKRPMKVKKKIPQMRGLTLTLSRYSDPDVISIGNFQSLFITLMDFVRFISTIIITKNT